MQNQIENGGHPKGGEVQRESPSVKRGILQSMLKVRMCQEADTRWERRTTYTKECRTKKHKRNASITETLRTHWYSNILLAGKFSYIAPQCQKKPEGGLSVEERTFNKILQVQLLVSFLGAPALQK